MKVFFETSSVEREAVGGEKEEAPRAFAVPWMAQAEIVPSIMGGQASGR